MVPAWHTVVVSGTHLLPNYFLSFIDIYAYYVLAMIVNNVSLDGFKLIAR